MHIAQLKVWINDYDCAKKALTVFVEHLNEEKIQEFKESNR